MSLLQNRNINEMQPNNVAAAKITIQTMATAGTPTIAICEAPPNNYSKSTKDREAKHDAWNS
jgi:hypothetical protein